jgi:hypothetical protein
VNARIELADSDAALAAAVGDVLAVLETAWACVDPSSALAVAATFAATHHDAHLVKYTLACIDVAARDPGMTRLYLSAAATLAGGWSEHPDGIPIG